MANKVKIKLLTKLDRGEMKKDAVDRPIPVVHQEGEVLELDKYEAKMLVDTNAAIYLNKTQQKDAEQEKKEKALKDAPSVPEKNHKLGERMSNRAT